MPCRPRSRFARASPSRGTAPLVLGRDLVEQLTRDLRAAGGAAAAHHQRRPLEAHQHPLRTARILSRGLTLAVLPLDEPALRFEYRLIWHERAHRDPGFVWLRDQIARRQAERSLRSAEPA
jgi:DNA-binding transcriptional LysR family regulator